MPCSSDTTAMIDVTATMFPSTIMSERILFTQMDERAMPMASRIGVISDYGLRTTDHGLRTTVYGLLPAACCLLLLPLRIDLHFVAVLQVPDVVERPGN